MAICRICNEEFYIQVAFELEEPCLCGQGAEGSWSLWQHNGFQAYRDWFRYRLAGQCYRFANWLVRGRR